MVDVRTAAGDVYFLEENNILIYGTIGIELQLNQSNLARAIAVMKTGECIKDSDIKNRRYTVAYDGLMKQFRFEAIKGETVYVPDWMLVVEEKIAA